MAIGNVRRYRVIVCSSLTRGMSKKALERLCVYGPISTHLPDNIILKYLLGDVCHY